MIRRLFFLLSLLAACAPTAAQMRIEMIPLQHRTVDELLPILHPLLAEGGTLTGMNDQLIVKSTDANIAEIRQVLETLDRRLRSLMIQVRRTSAINARDSGSSLEGEYRGDDVSVRNRDASSGQDGASVTVGDRHGSHARANVHQNRATEDNSGSYRVQAVEGQPAFIQTGQLVPIRQRALAASPYGVVQQDTVVYYDATSGFYVVPQLSGDRVQLMISPFITQTNPGVIPSFDVQNVETMVSGRLGEWIPLGGIAQSTQRTQNGILSTDSGQISSQADFSVLVEEIR